MPSLAALPLTDLNDLTGLELKTLLRRSPMITGSLGNRISSLPPEEPMSYSSYTATPANSPRDSPSTYNRNQPTNH